MHIKKLSKEDIITYENELKEYIKLLITPYTKEEINIEVKRIYDNMRRFTEDNTAIILGAFDNENLIGFIWGYRKLEQENTIHINYFFINEKYRSKGIGSKLLKKMQKIVEEKCDELELFVSKKNIKAFDFYKNGGFEIEEFYIDKVKLRKRIK